MDVFGIKELARLEREKIMGARQRKVFLDKYARHGAQELIVQNIGRFFINTFCKS
jgi:hypothetical protein